MRVIVMPIIDDVLETVLKGLKKKLKELEIWGNFEVTPIIIEALRTVSKNRNSMNWKEEEMLKSPILKHHWNQLVYLEESWRPK